MKVAELGESLRAASQVPAWALLRRLCPLFDTFAGISVQNFVKVARSRRIEQLKSSGPLLGEAAEALRAISSVVTPIAKAGAAKDLADLIALFSDRAELSIDSFVSALVGCASKREREKEKRPVDDKLIDKYLERLEATLGDERAFSATFGELRNDKRMLQEHVVAIANRFMGKTPSSTSRSKALERILQRHTKLMKFKARTEGMSGKSAA
jgi:hypothetical protein